MTGNTRRRTGRLCFAPALLVLSALTALPLQASISEPDHLLYGQVSWFGEPVDGGELTLQVEAWDGPVARYELFSDPALGSQYALRVPMNSTGERIPGTARQGDEAVVFLDGEPIALFEIGERGMARRFDLDPANLEGVVALSIDDIEVAEGDAGEQTPAVFTVTLSEPLEDPVSFSWATQDGEGVDAAVGGAECSPGVDYIQDFGSGNMGPGNVATSIEVTVCGNDDQDGNRHFFVALSDASEGVGLLKPLGEAVIVDNNTLPQLFIEDITVVEPPVGETRQAVFHVSLSETWPEPVSVNWSTANGSAMAGTDYVAASGTLNMAAGQQDAQIPVTVLANPADNDDRDFFVDLADPVQATLGRAQGRALIVDSIQTLVHVETQQNGVTVTGMSDPADIAVASPDGDHVYVASRTADELVVFERDAQTGRLTALESIAVSGFLGDRDDQRAIDGINGFADLAVAGDGGHVYAVSQTDDAIVLFARNTDDSSPDYGRLSVAQVLFEGDQPSPSQAPPVAGLLGPRGLAVAPDGDNVYVAGSGAPGHVVVFSRNSADGTLLFRQHLERGQDDPLGNAVLGIGNASAIVVSPDNSRIYVTGQSDDAVAVFNRNLSDNGRLSFRVRYVHGLGGVSGLQAPSDVVLSAGGAHLYATGRDSNSIAVFRRQTSGDLEWQQAIVAGTDGVGGLEAPLSLAISADGELVYVGSASDGTEPEPGTLTVLSRNSDAGDVGYGELMFVELKRNNTGTVTGLWGATGVAISPDDAHIYVAARFDQAVVVFARDLLAPVNPVLDSPSHVIEIWNNNPQIEINWSGAEDLDPSGTSSGSGLMGYSVAFTRDELTDPDDAIDVPHATDPHGLLSEPLEDAIDHWFHLRACDNAGNCADTARLGPFWIDATAPAGPSNLDSPTHDPGGPAIPDNVIEVTWDPAADSGPAPSGLAGYSYVFNQSQTAEPNTLIDLGPAAVGVSSEVLDDGLWYFHIRPIDTAGNAGQTRTIGPFGVGDDVTPPEVFEILAVAAPEAGSLMPGAVIDNAVTQLLVRFDKPMDSGAAADLASFRLLEGVVDPAGVACGDPDAGLLGSAGYIGPDRLSHLRVDAPTGLAAGDYTLIVCDSLEDFNGNGLDGNGDGSAGGHFGLSFTVAWNNLLPNPNFDDPLGPDNWGVNAVQIGHQPNVDLGGVATSGSALIDVDQGDPSQYALTRCINLDSGLQPGFALQARVRATDAFSDPNPFEATASMTFHTGSGCGDTLQGFVSNPVIDDSGGAWVPLSTSISPGAVAGAGSVLVSLNLSFPAGTAFPLLVEFDNAVFFAFGEGELPTAPPRVTRVLSTTLPEYGDLGQSLPTEAAITQLVPEFSRGVVTVPGGNDPTAANNVDNYRLFDLSLGGDPDCSTAGGLGLDPLVSYQAARKRSVLRLSGDRALPAGPYRLVVCGSIRDFDNNELAGGEDDTQGVDHVLDFEVAATNVLRNPNLDSTAGQWSLGFDPVAGELRWSAADADGQLSSGALRIQHQSGPDDQYQASQCVNLGDESGLVSLGARVLTSQAFGTAPTVAAAATFFDGSDCAGGELDELQLEQAMGHSAGQWQLLFGRMREAPAAAASVRVTYQVSATEDAPFDVWIDSLTLRFGAADVIFRNRLTPEIF
ncbi:MAG: beta-propeller fold lactonase family protein [Pseudomonadota bacterium]|nr:MAG: beta-propeller fold lactonase family protein [Pseudomonadota bacterium]